MNRDININTNLHNLLDLIVASREFSPGVFIDEFLAELVGNLTEEEIKHFANQNGWQYEWGLKNDIKGRKSALTKFDNKIEAAKCKLAKRNQGKLFSEGIEKELGWDKVVKKRKNLVSAIEIAEKQLEDLYSGELEIPKSSYACKALGREVLSNSPCIDRRKDVDCSMYHKKNKK